ncbi:hypothetical protein BH11CYA1_BH11CYA1_23490 [soil metagenome]
MQNADIKSAAAGNSIRETAASLHCAIERLMVQEPGPQDPLFIINNFQHIAAFGRARLAFHKAMAARPNVHTDMFVVQSGDIKVAGAELLQAVADLAIVSAQAWQYSQRLAGDRSNYLRALEAFGDALGYPVYDPGALSYNRRESDSPLYFD